MTLTDEDLVLETFRVFELPKVAADALAVGDKVYWRSSDGLVTGTASGNTTLGVAVSDSGRRIVERARQAQWSF